MKNYGFVPADILLPENTDMTKWSCVACDQYTSEPDYWSAVEDTVGSSPSTLRLMLPEIYLDETESRTPAITAAMKDYLEGNVFKWVSDSFVYVERTLRNNKVRRGLVGAIDLEIYDYSEGTQALCRPTEATVTSRLPARVKVRSDAEIEMPHIMMLLDDPQKTVIEQFASRKNQLPCLYDFKLMQDSGSISGYRVSGDDARDVMLAVERLHDASSDANPMLYAMGDGNHSLAAAKLYYENLKEKTGDAARNHPARYALVELVNLHDDSLEFEAIHRVVFNVDTADFMNEFKNYCGLTEGGCAGQQFTVVIGAQESRYTFTAPKSSLTVGNIQDFIDTYTALHGGETDYIHGEDVVRNLARSAGRIGFIVDPIGKDSFFNVIKKDGVLPRKTFSMGHACDKRFYLECRKITL